MSVPDALLLISSHCPHCPAMIAMLTDLVKTGQVGRLEIVNVEVRPEAASNLNARAVPWLRIGAFVLTGMQDRQALLDLIGRLDEPEALAEHFHALLRDGRLPEVMETIQRSPEHLSALLPIVANPEASINVRIGAGVVFEEMAGGDALRAQVGKLGELTRHTDARVRADACHYLGLSGDRSAMPILDACLEDDNPDVREIAAESLAALGAS